jgi:DNA-binding MarR family transcriptional regulator
VEVVRALARVSRVLERSSDEISLANYRILSAIGSGDHRASRVGAKLALGKPTVSAAVESLCLRGLVSRSTIGGDQRVVNLNLTHAGRALLERVEEAMIRRVTDLCARTPDGARLMEALTWLGPAIDDSLSERAPTRRSGR